MIKIIAGTYGYLDKNGIVKPKTVDDEPFCLKEEQEKRLVDLGVAEYVNKSVDEENTESKENNETDLQVDAEEKQGIPEYDMDTKMQELKTIAKEYMGIEPEFGEKKADLIARMDAYRDENCTADDVEMPDLGDIVVE